MWLPVKHHAVYYFKRLQAYINFLVVSKLYLRLVGLFLGSLIYRVTYSTVLS